MTTRANLSPAFTQLFEAEVHQAYQGAAVLTGAARTRTGVVGSTVNFPKVGKGAGKCKNSCHRCRSVEHIFLKCRLYAY